ncbi:hypothetical protein [Paraflavitalea speifideaquila]|uniref:hypothetical protein n=1 Tax=Paraflavitalea speifideaquila TaxID=3076558 RepID=UPI0028E76573|nr:hypothetical protein [Paraflavitalea speifideiaquila]
MKLQDQVCSSDQAKRLKELGIAQDSLFVITYGTGRTVTRDEAEKNDLAGKAAFTVAELLMILPEVIEVPNTPHSAVFILEKGYDHYSESECYTAGYKLNGDWFIGSGFPNASEALCEVLLTLLREKFLTAEEVNKRLQA